MPDRDLTKAIACAANNADLYQAVFRAQGLSDYRDAAMWWSADTAPPYYANLTTLDPEACEAQTDAIAQLKAGLRRTFSVKDGFCRLGLAPLGFSQLFGASWIWSEPEQIAEAAHNELPDGWRRIVDAVELEAWEMAWTAGGSPAQMRVFPQTILRDPNVIILGRAAAQEFDAGCIANISAGVVGLSNVFSTTAPASSIFAAATLAASAIAPCLPLAGYEHGDDLDAAITAGFKRVGELRIWLLD